MSIDGATIAWDRPVVNDAYKVLATTYDHGDCENTFNKARRDSHSNIIMIDRTHFKKGTRKANHVCGTVNVFK